MAGVSAALLVSAGAGASSLHAPRANAKRAATVTALSFIENLRGAVWHTATTKTTPGVYIALPG